MASFDVESLYTNFPVEDALKTIEACYRKTMFQLAFKVETMGTWSEESKDLTKELGMAKRTVSGEIRSHEYLKQRISMAIQCGNASGASSSLLEENFIRHTAWRDPKTPDNAPSEHPDQGETISRSVPPPVSTDDKYSNEPTLREKLLATTKTLKQDTPDSGGEYTCVVCGSNAGKHGRVVRGSPVEQFIEAANFPRKLHKKSLICYGCYKRFSIDGKQKDQKERRKPSSRGALSEKSANANVSNTDESAMISLPNYKRAPGRFEACLFPNCQMKSLNIIPQYLKQSLLRDYKLYTPEHSQICKEHLLSKKWEPLLNIAMSDFTAQQIEDVISTLTTNVTAFNFDDIEDIPPNLLLYCTGIDNGQLQKLFEELPALARRTNTPMLALSAYLTKLRTKESFERLSTLFETNKTILKRKAAVAKGCMLTKFFPRRSRVSLSSDETKIAFEVVTEDDRMLSYLRENYYGKKELTRMHSSFKTRASFKSSQCQKRKYSSDSDDETLASAARSKKRLIQEEAETNESIENDSEQYTISDEGVKVESPERAENVVVSEGLEDVEEDEHPRVKKDPDDDGESVDEAEMGDLDDRHLVYAPNPTEYLKTDPLDTVAVPAPFLDHVKNEEYSIPVKEDDSQSQPTALEPIFEM